MEKTEKRRVVQGEGLQLELMRTIEEIEKERKKFEKMTQTKAVSEQIKKLKREDVALRIAVKKRVMELESGNRGELIIFPTGGGFAKMTENSAIFYLRYTSKQIGRRAKLRTDTDYYNQSKIGVLSVKYDGIMAEKFRAIGLKLDEEKTSRHIFVYKMQQSFTDEEIAGMRDALKQAGRKINAIVLPKSTVPTLYGYINDLSRMVFNGAKRMPEFGRNTIGDKLFERVMVMSRDYLKVANGLMAEKDGWKEIYLGAISIKISMKTVHELTLMDEGVILRILETEQEIEKLAKNLMAKEKRREAGKKD